MMGLSSRPVMPKASCDQKLSLLKSSRGKNSKWVAALWLIRNTTADKTSTLQIM